MGKFLVKTVSNGTMFDVIASNGQIIAVSQVYSSEASCMKGIESVRTNAPIAEIEDQTKEGFEEKTCPKYEVYHDKAGEPRFRLKARNGEIIAASQGYKEKEGCLHGIESLRKNAPDAEIVKEG